MAKNVPEIKSDKPYPKGAWVQINPALYVSSADPLIKPPPTHVAGKKNVIIAKKEHENILKIRYSFF